MDRQRWRSLRSRGKRLARDPGVTFEQRCSQRGDVHFHPPPDSKEQKHTVTTWSKVATGTKYWHTLLPRGWSFKTLESVKGASQGSLHIAWSHSEEMPEIPLANPRDQKWLRGYLGRRQEDADCQLGRRVVLGWRQCFKWVAVMAAQLSKYMKNNKQTKNAATLKWVKVKPMQIVPGKKVIKEHKHQKKCLEPSNHS